MSANGQHHSTNWDRTPFGCLSTRSQRGRRPSIAEALAEVAARH